MYFTFLKLQKWYQIVQRISYSLCLVDFEWAYDQHDGFLKVTVSPVQVCDALRDLIQFEQFNVKNIHVGLLLSLTL